MEEFAALVPEEVLPRSGNVFLSGRASFSGKKDLYLLGINPGADHRGYDKENIGAEIAGALERSSDNYSSYSDGSWDGGEPGTARMQPRVLHLLEKLSLDPRLTPSSNLIFVRSNTENDLKSDHQHLLDICWPFHRAVIDKLGIKIVVAMGKTAGAFLREKMEANELVERFVENNERNWTSEVHIAPSGIMVATLTHPARADWTNPQSDPTEILKRALQRNSNLTDTLLRNTSLDLADSTVRDVNRALKSATEGSFEVINSGGAHALACGLDAAIDVTVKGHAGYYCAGMNKTASVTVEGNASTGVAENMMSGLVRVKGNVSQSAGATAHGGLLVIEGDASARCGISLKGAEIVVGGSVGHMSAFMAQAGALVVCGDAGEALGDSIYEARLYVRGSVASLGADCIEKEMRDEHRKQLADLLSRAGIDADVSDFKRYGSARKLYNFKIDNAY